MSVIERKRILLISPQSWEHIWVSKHHYAVSLSKRGNEVYFLGPPKGNAYSIRPTSYDDLFLVEHPGWPKGFRFYPKRMVRKRILKEVRALEDLAGVSFDLIWNFDDSVFYDLSELPDRIYKILHIMDEGQDHHLKRAASTSDISFGVTPFIVDKLRKGASNAETIGHGLSESSIDKDVELPGPSPYKAVFTGNLSAPLLDWESLYHSIKGEERVDLCFIGPGKDDLDERVNPTMKWKARLKELPNVFFLGTKPSEELISYYRAADLLLLARLEGYKQVANSHKLLEYLSSGKCVLATHTHCYEGVDDDILRMSRKNQEFPALFRDTIDRIESYNSNELMEKRRSFARQFTYEKRIQEIEEYLERVRKEKESSS